MKEIEKYNSSIGMLIEPESIGYSFNTPGWYILLGILLFVVLLFAILQYRKYLKNAYRRAAIYKIELLVQNKNNNTVFDINLLLKTMAIQLFGREKVASLYGVQWFEFLHKTLKSKVPVKSNLFGDFTEAIYNNQDQIQKQQFQLFADFAILWVKNHDTNHV